MRVSDSIFYDMNRLNLERARQAAADAQEQASSGRRVNRPSDDPLAVVLAKRERHREARAENHVRAVDTALAGLQIAESALAQVNDILHRARELAVMSSNDTFNAQNREATAREIEELQRQVISQGNMKADGGRYIFAGYNDKTAPFDENGNYVTDGNVRQVEVAPSVRLDANVDPRKAFGVGQGTNVMDTLEALRAALDADDTAAIQATLDDLEAASDQLASARAEIGGIMVGFEVARSAAETTKAQAMQRQTDYIGLNEVDAFMNFSQAQSALQTAIQIASQLPPPSLISR